MPIDWRAFRHGLGFVVDERCGVRSGESFPVYVRRSDTDRFEVKGSGLGYRDTGQALQRLVQEGKQGKIWYRILIDGVEVWKARYNDVSSSPAWTNTHTVARYGQAVQAQWGVEFRAAVLPVVVQYASDDDKEAADIIAAALDVVPVKATSIEDVPLAERTVFVGAQEANPVFKEVVEQGPFRNVTENDAGYIYIQYGLWDGNKVWGVAGWSKSDTIESAKYIRDNGLPLRGVKVRYIAEPPPEYKALPTPPPEFPKKFIGYYKELDSALAAKDPAKVLAVLRKYQWEEASPIAFIAAALAITGVASIIMTVVQSYTFAGFINEETLQTADMTIYQSQRSNEFDLAQKALNKKKELFKPNVWDNIISAVPIANVAGSLNKFRDVSQFKMSIDQELINRKISAVVKPHPGNIVEYAKGLEKGVEMPQYLPKRVSILTIDSNAPGGEIIVNGVGYSAMLPFAVEVEPGSVTVTIKAEGYIEETKVFNIEPYTSVSKYIKLQEEPKAGIKVKVKPVAASIYYNGSWAGETTEVDIEGLEEKEYTVRVEHDDYEADPQKVTATKKPYPVVEFDMKPKKKTGTIAIKFNTTNVTIWKGTEKIGDTGDKDTIELVLPATKNDLIYRAEGYKDYRDSVYVSEGVNPERSITLEEAVVEPDKSYIKIYCTEPDVEIWFGSKMWGKTDKYGRLDVLKGSVKGTITAKKDGFVDEEVPITHYPPNATEVSITMHPIQPKQIYAQVTCVTIPEGATIYVDGYPVFKDGYVKRTPYTFLLKPRAEPYEITLILEGYEPETEMLDLSSPPTEV